MDATFPSPAFFEELRRRLDAESARFAKLGWFDATFGVRVLPEGDTPGKLVVIAFDAYACSALREVPYDDAVGALDFVLEAPLGVWRAMLRSPGPDGRIDADHTINTLSHHGDPMRVASLDPLGHDKLFRYQESVQAVFDVAGAVERGAASDR